MGLMDKFKNLFTEEVEEEIEVKEEPIKKETIHVEIPSPAKPAEKEITKEEPAKEKEEFKFPFFDDEDFHEFEDRPKPKEKEERKTRTAQIRKEKEVYKPLKEEKKIFKPTPIISPVYGILDKNYQKEDIKTKNTKLRSYYNPKEATVDEIRNKAYGTLEDEIETTLFGRNRLLFDDMKEDNGLIEDIEKEEVKEVKEDYADSIIGERPRHVSEESEEITDLLEAELGKEEEKKPHKISDSELFDMIDSMYQKGGKDDD